MTIRITIKAKSKAARAFKKYLAEKKAFKEAVAKGNARSYAQNSPIKFDLPV
jgi:hypothetical protein